MKLQSLSQITVERCQSRTGEKAGWAGNTRQSSQRAPWKRQGYSPSAQNESSQHSQADPAAASFA